MSAFIVEDKTINRIVSLFATGRDMDWARSQFKERGFDLNIEEGRAALGAAMFALNVKAVMQRYPDDKPENWRAMDYRFNQDINVNKISVFKSLQCWLYQCSEGDVPETVLYKFMDKMAGRLAETIVRDLPAYERSEWA